MAPDKPCMTQENCLNMTEGWQPAAEQMAIPRLRGGSLFETRH
jgi:hypothetical protein